LFVLQWRQKPEIRAILFFTFLNFLKIFLKNKRKIFKK